MTHFAYGYGPHLVSRRVDLYTPMNRDTVCSSVWQSADHAAGSSCTSLWRSSRWRILPILHKCVLISDVAVVWNGHVHRRQETRAITRPAIYFTTTLHLIHPVPRDQTPFPSATPNCVQATVLGWQSLLPQSPPSCERHATELDTTIHDGIPVAWTVEPEQPECGVRWRHGVLELHHFPAP